MRRGLLALLFLVSPLSAANRNALYGHFPYSEAASAQLADAGFYRDTGRVVRLRAEAAEAFKVMAAAAAAQGVQIVPVSGFRPVSYQKGLWDRAVARRGSKKAAAKWVAPPGHSEHHTGWSLDVADGDVPMAEDIESSFEKTKASAWLRANAAQFHFELSFPPANPQGVSYEPWHWRYIGTEESLNLFHPTR